jgi:hypothetical protein
MKKTEEEIEHMIQQLTEQKKSIPEYTSFGDSNWESIDFMIDVLTNEWSEADVYDKDEEFHVESAGIIASQWLDGEIPDEEMF